MKKNFFLLVLFFAFAGGIAAQSRVSYTLIMRNLGTKVLHDGDTVRTFGFAAGLGNPPVPGPMLIANEGDTFDVYVRNISQGAPHTIHWHGLDVPMEMDGVPHTSFYLEHMQDTNYVFVAQHSGTYMYHCHVHSVEHVQMGMYGPLLIRPADGSFRAWTGGPAYDKEYFWLTSEIDKFWHDNVIDTPHTDTVLHEEVHVFEYDPSYFLVNGFSQWQLEDSLTAISAKVGEKVFLRVANMGYYMHRLIFPSTMGAVALESDGRPLPAGVAGDTLELWPGERYGIMLTPSAEMDSSVQVLFADLNTLQVHGTEKVPLHIHGYIGVDDPSSAPTLEVYPNPASEVIHIRWGFTPVSEKEIQLMDMSGKLIRKTVLPATVNGAHSMSAESLPPGMYVVRFHDASGVRTQKVAVIR